MAGVVSSVSLGLVAAQLDWRSLAIGDISWTGVVAGATLLAAGSLFGALRTWLIAGGRSGMRTALRVTAWHGIWLIGLPLRLGEVAWVASMRRAYGWNAGAAVACALAQRLLDLGVVAGLLLLTTPAAVGPLDYRLPALSLLAVVVCLLGFIGAMTLGRWLRLAAGIAIGIGRRRHHRSRRWRSLAHHLNQARHWLDDARHRRALRRAVVPTVLSWTAVVAAYHTLGLMVGLDITPAQSGFATAGSNLVAALPVQSIGGLGLLEAGFTGIVTGVGAPAGTAALAALAIRFASLTAVVLFWLVAAAAAGKPAEAPRRDPA